MRSWISGLVGAAALALGAFALPSAADADVPLPPPSITIVDSSDTGFTLSWEPSPSSDVEKYQVQSSLDAGVTWQDVPNWSTTATQFRVPAAAAGHTVHYRVVAVNADGESAPTDDYAWTTPGRTAQTFFVRMADGTPVTGGDVELPDASGMWSYTGFTLDSHGEVTLPSVPAGTSQGFRITQADIEGHLTVEKSFWLDFGTKPQTLIVPPPPPMIVDKITVTMPGGIPAVGVEVDAGYYDALLDSVDTADYFGYTNLNVGSDGRTDAAGVATVRGWSAQGVDFIPAPKYPYPEQAVNLTYNDHVLHSDSVALLTGTNSAVQIDPLPYTTTTDPSTVPVGDTATALFRVHAAPARTVNAARTAATKSLAGVHVSLVPPKGWSATACSKKSTLTGISDSTGYVKLPVCATHLMHFTVVTKGALPTAPITLTTRQSVPGAPATARASSPSRGQLRVAWTKALYSGGAHVSGYRVIARSKGHRAARWTSTARGRGHTFNHLAHSTRWTVTVCAINAHGTGSTRTTHAKVR